LRRPRQLFIFEICNLAIFFRNNLMTTESSAASHLSPDVISCIRHALGEDIGGGDITTKNIVTSKTTATAHIVAKQDGVLAGLDVVGMVFLLLDKNMGFKLNAVEGAHVVRNQILCEVSGPTSQLLTGERTALNFLGRMSGIATLTRQFVDAVSGTRAVILDTRKTAPGLRALDKLAVKRGGGQNHRMDLHELVLIKDNHIDYAGSLANALKRVRATANDVEIEVEARTIADLEEALKLGVRRILLDNMTISELRKAVTLNAGHATLEASGNVSLENVREIAETGVDFISVGALTHSPKAFDVSLKLIV
jgi:nicotinate-nucleotide pyrophosphorylase (carboxylating)